ncbi:MAG: o-succinylbenzoate--CoA ligase [Betaproteobacteria bacterium]|nr:o-succinylbenzoate--CoA ligase [Betaproteobacteria bacterium]
MNPDAPALAAAGESLDYRELAARVATATGRLRTLGVGAGDRVGLRAANSVEWIVACLAVERAGAVLVPLNTRLSDPEIEWQLGLSRPKIALASDELAARAPRGTRWVSFEEWRRVRPGETGAASEPEGAPRDAAIVFTSGTTGRPKGAVITRANRIASARAAAAVLPLAPGDRWLASLPFFHVGGLGILARCFGAGACIELPDSFSADDLSRAVEQSPVTHLSVVDATLRRIIEGRGGRGLPDRVKAAVVGGGPVSAALVEACPQAIATYGLTESCAMVTLVRPGAGRDERLTAGRALPGIDLRVAPDGVIEVRGPVVMRGYLDDEDATAAVLRDGWLRTGDLGEIDARGNLRVLARRDDLIVSGGENVYPAEIEQALLAHPAVADALVVGVPDERWGEVPLALVVLRGPAEPDLRAFLETRLARYKLPRIVFERELPRLANGKPDRATVKSRLAGAS